MLNSNSLYCSTLDASTASGGIGMVSRADLLSYLHTRSDGACFRSRSTRPSVDPRSLPVHLARARAAFINVYARQVCRLCLPIGPIHALFQCNLPPLPSRRQHCCMPVAPPKIKKALDRPCTHHDLSRRQQPRPVPVTPVCWQTSPCVQVPSVDLLSPAPSPSPQARHLIEAANPTRVCSRPRLSECHSPLNV
jgi:hypothetical protein